jgi:hypothetical protein
METERLILDSIRESDKEDYFINISHDKKGAGDLYLPICGFIGGIRHFLLSGKAGPVCDPAEGDRASHRDRQLEKIINSMA